MPELDVNENEGVYYGGGYWNELEPVQRMFRERISNGAPGQWYRDFSERHAEPFRRALILNCGNGWVEREMASANLFKEALGIDYSEALLEEARLAATAAGLPLTYRQMNINKASFESGDYDLVVNHAAAHHIAMIDRVFREICRTLPEDGWFLSLDYVGPHRNQYTSEAWEQARRVNEQLPVQLRQSMSYPYLPLMLHDDPTEAIHSELIVETMQRYFHVERFVPLGGAIAYPLLTFNTGIFGLTDEGEQATWVEHVLRADAAFLDEHPDSSLFAYVVARPNKEALEQSAALASWEREETEREERARANGGEYYPRTALQDAYVRLVAEADATAALRQEVVDLQLQLDALRHDPMVSRLNRLRASSPYRALRSNPLARRLYEMLRW
jgi:SAM-dependent methyltransferase